MKHFTCLLNIALCICASAQTILPNSLSVTAGELSIAQACEKAREIAASIGSQSADQRKMTGRLSYQTVVGRTYRAWEISDKSGYRMWIQASTGKVLTYADYKLMADWQRTEPLSSQRFFTSEQQAKSMLMSKAKKLGMPDRLTLTTYQADLEPRTRHTHASVSCVFKDASGAVIASIQIAALDGRVVMYRCKH